MKKNFNKINRICALAFITMSIVSTLAYATSDEQLKEGLLLKIDPNILAIIMAPLAVVNLILVVWHAGKMIGWKPALKIIGPSLAIVYILEEIGVHTGLVFGRYYFTQLMGPKLDVIPIAIICGWVVLIYITWIVTNLLIDGSPTPTSHTPCMIVFKSLVGAMVITSFDLNADPIGVANGWWVWLDGGTYFGVPIQNYVGWFILAFITYIVIGYQLHRKQAPALKLASVVIRRLSIAPLVVYGLSGLAFIFINFAGQLGLISVYLFGIPFLIAIWKWVVWYKALAF